jgi:hypothetical protein
MAEDCEFVSTGGLVDVLNVNESTLRKWLRLGVLPPGRRVLGSSAFVWPMHEVPLMRQRVAERRAARKEALATKG